MTVLVPIHVHAWLSGSELSHCATDSVIQHSLSPALAEERAAGDGRRKQVWYVTW